MKNINHRLFCALFGLSFLNNFKIINISFSRGIIITELIVLMIIILNINRLQNFKSMLIILCFIILPFLNFGTVVDTTEFFKTYFSMLFYASFIVITHEIEVSKRYLQFFIYSTKILAVYGIVQFLYSFYIGPSDIIHMPFGINHTSLITYYTNINNFYRSNSLYYEPSIFGLYSMFSLSLCYTFDFCNTKINKLIFFIGILISLSGTAYLYLIFIMYRLLINKSKKLIKNYLIFLLSIISTSIILYFYLFNRLKEIFIPGSTAFYRIIAPFQAILEIIIKKNIFGIGFGQLDFYLSNTFLSFFQIQWEQKTSIDNIPAVIIMYMGILSIPLFFFLFKLLLINLNKNSIYIISSFIIFIFGTGAINYIYFNIIFALFILSLKLIKINNYTKIGREYELSKLTHKTS